MDAKPKPPGKHATQAEQDAYAQSLLRMVNLDYQKQQAQKPKTRHVMSKKWIIIAVVSVILCIIIGWLMSLSVKPSGTSGTDTLNGINSAANPNDY